MVFNPHIATITVIPHTNVGSFRLQYVKDGDIVAELVQPANYVSGDEFIQNLLPLNALVPQSAQAGNMVLAVRAINAGGESEGQTTASEQIQVVTPPSTPALVVVS